MRVLMSLSPAGTKLASSLSKCDISSVAPKRNGLKEVKTDVQ